MVFPSHLDLPQHIVRTGPPLLSQYPKEYQQLEIDKRTWNVDSVIINSLVAPIKLASEFTFSCRKKAASGSEWRTSFICKSAFTTYELKQFGCDYDTKIDMESFFYMLGYYRYIEVFSWLNWTMLQPKLKESGIAGSMDAIGDSL